MQTPTIHTIDLLYLGIPGSIAAYVVMGDEGPVLVETGPASTLDALRAGLAKIGLQAGDIRHALVTHIHLDHAGAAGQLAQNGTRIYVHEFGSKHLIDPSKLIESATRIYGEQMERLWGRMIPVPQELITPVHDGDVIELGRLRFRAVDTPGHARHHHAFALDDVCFTGDVAGITLPTSIVPEPPVGGFMTVPTPPPEFDLDAWIASIDRLNSMNFRAIYPTHFGVRHNVPEHFELTRSCMIAHAEFVRSRMEVGQPREVILPEYIEWNRAQATTANVGGRDFARYVSTNLLTMNVDGMLRYWGKRIATNTGK